MLQLVFTLSPILPYTPSKKSKGFFQVLIVIQTTQRKTEKNKLSKMARHLSYDHTDILNDILRLKFADKIDSLRYVIAHVLYNCHVEAGTLEEMCRALALTCQTDRALRANVMALIFVSPEDIDYAKDLFLHMQEAAEKLENCSAGACLKPDARVACFATNLVSSVVKDVSDVQRFLSVHRQPEAAMQGLILDLSTREWAGGAVINEKEKEQLGYMAVFAKTMYEIVLKRECLQDVVGLRLE